MKKLLLTLLICASLAAESQVYNNEWINYSRTYYKFKVGTSGLFRINQPVLVSNGIGNTPAEQFQLWRNGKQVPIYTTVQTGIMTSTDYIEFWGDNNDGKADNELYRDADYQLNDKWSLQSDTAAFFLTINPVIAENLRLVPASFTLPSAIPVEPYFIYTAGKYFQDRLNAGFAQLVGDYVYSSAYDQGEGWTSAEIGTGTTFNTPFTPLYPYTGASAPPPQLKINAAGNAANPRSFTVKINGTQVLNQTMDFFDYVKANVTGTVAQISSGTASIDVTNNSSVANDRMVVAEMELKYARQFNFGGAANFAFELPANTNGNYLEIAGFSTGSVNPVLYDFTNGKRYTGDVSVPGLVRIVLQPSATARKLLLVSEGAIFTPTPLQKRNFVNYAQAAQQGNYLIITHPALLNGTGGATPIEDYRTYRASVAGGSYNAKVYMIDELVDQFAFGIKMHPSSVRNFIRWARNTFSSPVKDVLLIGKGLTYNNFRVFESYPDIDKLSFVPTFGQPASDNLLAADPGLNEIPKVPIGRISAINADEVAVYLAKLKQYEQVQGFSSPAISDKAWMKNVVHVEGSSEPTLQLILDNYMDKYKGLISDTLFGGLVYTFAKNTANPVEELSSEKLNQLFHEGLGLITYFGHSSASTLEFNLDNPDQYDNAGKYPVMIVMGCNAGNFFNYNTLRLITRETLSEKFLLANQKGSIAFIASSSLGIVHYLDIFNTQTYSGATTTQYGKTLGETLINSISQVYNITTQNDFYARFHCEQTILHGDPALKMNSFSKPDYVIEDQLVKISPSFISVAETSFKVDAKFQNLGKAINKNIVVEVKRTYPNLTTQVIQRDTIPGIRFVDSISYTIPVVASRDKGLNKITITIDADNAVDELYETNNSITKDVFIYEDEARPVYPYNYAIVNKQNIKLIASTANPFVGLKQYTMELDTTELFNSSQKVSRTISSTGGVLEFTPGITFTDSTVYFWRVAPVSQGQPVWNKFSFVYLPASSDGFNQSHFFQKTKSDYDRVIIDTASRSFKFGTVTNNLFIRQGTWITSGANQEASLSIAINSIASIRLCCWYSSLVINVFDPVSFKPWFNHTLVHDNYPADLGLGLYESTANQCRSDEERYFNFEYRYTDTAGRRKIMNFLKNVIPDGAYIAVRNFSLDPGYGFPEAFVSVWKADTAYYGPGNSLYHLLKNAGLSGMDSFYRTRPFALVYKKNDASFTPKWLMGDGMYDNPTLSVDCVTIDTVGFVTSPLFGPAKAWKQLKWRGSAEATPGDIATVDVIGVDNSGVETPLFTNITTAQQDFDVSSVSAINYPFIKLRMRTQDSIHYTPYQLRYWRLTYDPSPEGAIAPNIYLKVKDTVEIGEPSEFKVAFRNISAVAFDSLKVKMVVTDKNNVPHIIPIAKKRPLLTVAPNDTLYLGSIINTSNLSGVNTIYLEANPDADQPEQYHFNNFAYRTLYVKPDSLNPLLDVTFDGQHILNRDIVSPKPDIVVKLKDEAHWLSLDDTSLLTVNVRYPNGSIRRYYFNNDTLRFTPAGQVPVTDNTATINFKPLFATDGEYELIVTGKDKSNNSAGTIEYRVTFEVINKPMISNMLNYPNPFTTSTAFVFTITGSEIPQNIKIEIMTITGKIVREITKDELGSLHIGRNITEFKWDGTDQYGQKLANGIYLYRVVTNLNGKSLDKYKAQDDNTDKYFNKGYGKMYLMR